MEGSQQGSEESERVEKEYGEKSQVINTPRGAWKGREDSEYRE